MKKTLTYITLLLVFALCVPAFSSATDTAVDEYVAESTDTVEAIDTVLVDETAALEEPAELTESEEPLSEDIDSEEMAPATPEEIAHEEAEYNLMYNEDGTFKCESCENMWNDLLEQNDFASAYEIALMVANTRLENLGYSAVNPDFENLEQWFSEENIESLLAEPLEPVETY
jgi:hypothetical protein